MKTLRVVSILVLGIGLLFSASSCAVFVKHDNGRHRGQYLAPGNRNHPQNSNPEHHKGNSNKVASMDADHGSGQETMRQGE